LRPRRRLGRRGREPSRRRRPRGTSPRWCRYCRPFGARSVSIYDDGPRKNVWQGHKIIGRCGGPGRRQPAQASEQPFRKNRNVAGSIGERLWNARERAPAQIKTGPSHVVSRCRSGPNWSGSLSPFSPQAEAVLPSLRLDAVLVKGEFRPSCQESRARTSAQLLLQFCSLRWLTGVVGRLSQTVHALEIKCGPCLRPIRPSRAWSIAPQDWGQTSAF